MINYEEKVDCFKKTEHVKSTFIYGDKSKIKNPLITVFVPTYKRVDLLKQAIDSVLNQWHTDFDWDIIVVDNEPYHGKPNATEHLIRKIDNPRILYYRNSENMRPGDNFNRGILLARGKWVMMLHDDDLLVHSSLQNMGKLINAYDGIDSKPLGAISAYYHQFKYDSENPYKTMPYISQLNQHFCGIPIEIYYNLNKLNHTNIIFTSHIGGFVPSNGTTYLRDAVIWAGGFNDDYGISADLILFYNMQEKYSVYATNIPMGFYRWGANTMIKLESTYKTIKAGYDFREFVYKKSPIAGMLFRNCHYQKFTSDVVNDRNNVSKDKIEVDDFSDIYSQKPNKLWYFIYIHFILPIYFRYKRNQSKRIGKRAMENIKNEKNI